MLSEGAQRFGRWLAAGAPVWLDPQLGSRGEELARRLAAARVETSPSRAGAVCVVAEGGLLGRLLDAQGARESTVRDASAWLMHADAEAAPGVASHLAQATVREESSALHDAAALAELSHDVAGARALAASPRWLLGEARASLVGALADSSDRAAFSVLVELLARGAPWAGEDVAVALGRRFARGMSRWERPSPVALQWRVRANELPLRAALALAARCGYTTQWREADGATVHRLQLPTLPAVRSAADLGQPFVRLLFDPALESRGALWLGGVAVPLTVERELLVQLLCAASER